jgi:hypothetical protein
MGQKLPLCGQLGAARSRQDESKEVGEAGSKRASSGGNGGHHVWWSGLIFRLLRSRRRNARTRQHPSPSEPPTPHHPTPDTRHCRLPTQTQTQLTASS